MTLEDRCGSLEGVCDAPESQADFPLLLSDWEELRSLGRILDHRPESLRGLTVGMAMAERLLKVRTRDGRAAPLRANAAQREFERRRGRHNIVL